MTTDAIYILDDEFELVKANHRIFAIHYSTYRENIFFRQNWERRLSIFNEDTPCYWISLKGNRIGGVSIEPNMISSLFLLKISDLSKPIHAFGILPYQTEHFFRLGFLPSEIRRVMMRPTELFESQELGEELEVVTPTSEHTEKISELLLESYSGPDSIGYSGENTMEHQRSALEYYFKNNNSDILTAASSLVIDKSSNAMVAVCLISLWEEIPLVSNIAVIPRYRSNRIASKLLRRALTVLNGEYEVLRLFVTIGNSAEALYYNLGFYPGLEQTTFQLIPRSC
ncbi:GNAT superfamily N-acetyltransferase [Paenibacillus rhizosphaerae]|uniref:GNAT superfamily N-acetyltransferase n=1 Tax=Paenibacillus rhizosphaerae TaxID=297318 RepID=A0A839U5Y9_9BACL|nr:GNAT family N-acetyltransferase [Paenibacillus rhizosphaerae]MBB3132237.1 GNAT superfamily N-acetyltransferase [Paenibacillus rhizosphaerae]